VRPPQDEVSLRHPVAGIVIRRYEVAAPAAAIPQLLGRKATPNENAMTAETSEANAALTLQFLAFVAGDERTYGETMDAWRSTCPHMPIWENAVRDGLVRIESGGAMKSSRIVLTPQGRAVLHGNGA
jgi:hypothetical protein